MRFFNAVEPHSALLTESQFYHQLATEATLTDNVVDFFRTGLPSLVGKVKDFASILTFQTENEMTLDGMDRRKERQLEGSFLQFRDVLIQVPEGFQGEFLPYVRDLNQLGLTLFEQADQLLSSYRFTLAALVSDKGNRTAVRDMSVQYKKASEAREAIVKQLATHFHSDVRSRSRLVDVLPTYRDCHALIAETKALQLRVNPKQLKQIQRSVREIAETMQVLENQVSSKDVIGISPRVVSNVADGAYELARYVEQIAAYHYASLSIVGCVKQLVEKIKTFV